MTASDSPIRRAFVWDASALHHVGKAGRLDVLGSFVVGPASDRWDHCITDILRFANWTTLMSDGVHDLGEASVAAWASGHDRVAIIDDRDACAVARHNGCAAHGSMWLLCESIKTGCASVASVSTFADETLSAGAYLPFKRRGFAVWAASVGLLPDPHGR